MSSTPLNDLAQRLHNATAWTKDLNELNSAIQPYLSGELTLDALNHQIEVAQQKIAHLEEVADAKEQALNSVDTRLTLAEDVRKKHLDTDFAAYQESIESQKRQVAKFVETAQLKLDDLHDQLMAKSAALAELDTQIEERKRTLSGIKSQLAAVLAGAGNAAQ